MLGSAQAVGSSGSKCLPTKGCLNSPAPWALPCDKNDRIFFLNLNESGRFGGKICLLQHAFHFSKQALLAHNLLHFGERTSVPPNTLQTNCPCFAFDLNQIGKSFLTKLSSQKFHKCFGSLQLS